MASPREWYQDNYLISTSKTLIEPDAVNAAFASEMIYWANAVEDTSILKKMLDNSLCFGVYELPNSTSAIAGRSNPRQIGLARLITDEVSFAYLTDVYILEEFQGKGLGNWLTKCVDETLSSWPELRRAMLITSRSAKFYTDRLGMTPFDGGPMGLTVLTRKGAGSVVG